MKKIIVKVQFLLSLVYIVVLITGCTNSNPHKLGDQNDLSVDNGSQNTNDSNWISWLADHWNADATTWIETANSSCGGDVEEWLSSSSIYGYSQKIWNNVDAAHSIDPIIVSTDCDTLDDSVKREQLAKEFSIQLMDALCKNNESWSFQITEYTIDKVVTEKVSRDDLSETIWICFFFADFKFNGIISPIAIGNTDTFVGAESFGTYEMVLEDGNCIFYPIYSDNFQRITH